MANEQGASPISALSDVFDGGDSQSEGTSSSSTDEKSSTPEDSGEEGDQKFPASSPDESDEESGEQDDEKEEKADDKPAVEKPEKKDSTEKEETPSKEEKAAKDKWESEENPYLKRQRDTAANWQKEHQQNLQLQHQLVQMQQEMVTLRKIADGTYDPEKDDPSRNITPERVATSALEVGKSLASRHAAVQQFGAEKVEAALNEFHQVFEKNQLVQRLVLDSEAPVHEAMRILDRYKFEEKYGSTPESWHKTIRAEAEKELTEKLTKEITEKILGRADKKKSTPQGLHSSRGSNGLRSGQNSKGKGPTPLKEIF